MATQNYPIDGSAVSTSPQQSIGQGLGRQQQPMRMNTAVPVIDPMMFQDDGPRKRAKRVAICELCCACCYLTCIIVLFIVYAIALALLHKLRSSVNSTKSEPEPAGDPTEYNFSVVDLSIAVTLTIFEVIAAVGLLKATKPSTAPNVASRKASYWRCCSVLVVIFNFNFGLLCIASGLRLGSRPMINTGIIYFLSFAIRLLFIFLVNGFVEMMEERDSMVPDSTTESMANTNNRIQQQPQQPS